MKISLTILMAIASFLLTSAAHSSDDYRFSWSSAMHAAQNSQYGVNLAEELAEAKLPEFQHAYNLSLENGGPLPVAFGMEVPSHNQFFDFANLPFQHAEDGKYYASLTLSSSGSKSVSAVIKLENEEEVKGRGFEIIFVDASGKELERLPLEELNVNDGPRHTVSADGDRMYLVLSSPNPVTSVFPKLLVIRINHSPHLPETSGDVDHRYPVSEYYEVLDGAHTTGIAPEERASFPPGRSPSNDKSEQIYAECLGSQSAAYKDAMNASVRISFNKGSISRWCSGTIINRLGGYTLLTAAHCIGSQEEADTLRLKFNYRRVGCTENERSDQREISGGGDYQSSISGTGGHPYKSDISFINLRTTGIPPTAARMNLGYAPQNMGGQYLSLSHPGGEPLSAARFDYHSSSNAGAAAPTKSATFSLRGYIAGGSSGSGIFDYRNNKYQVIGDQNRCYTDHSPAVIGSVIDGLPSLQSRMRVLNQFRPFVSPSRLRVHVSYVDDHLYAYRGGTSWFDRGDGRPSDHVLTGAAIPATVSFNLYNGGCWAWGTRIYIYADNVLLKRYNPYHWIGHCGRVWSDSYTVRKYYIIRSLNYSAGNVTRHCLDNFYHTYGGLYHCHGGNNQKLRFSRGSRDRYYKLCAKNDNRCLKASGNSVVMSSPGASSCTENGCNWRFTDLGQLEPYGRPNHCISSSFYSRLSIVDGCNTHDDLNTRWQVLDAS